MALPLPVRFAALAIAGWLCAGCERNPGIPPTATATAQATPVAAGIPRALPAPTEAKPLAAVADQAALLLTQASATSFAPGSRIVELSVTPSANSGGAIRQPGTIATPAVEPLSPTVREPASSPALASSEPLRSAYAPPGVWPSAPPPTATSLPQLPVIPNFDRTAPAPSSGAQNSGYAAAPFQLPQQVAAIPAARSAFSPPAVATPRNDAMPSLAQQVQSISDRGLAMAQKGMLFAGRAELITALQLIAQALDVQQGGNTHATALASGLAALEEARDFSISDRQASAVVNVAAIVQSHRTSLLKTDPTAAEISPVVAQQRYFALAQAQLVVAGGGQPAASQVLYRLGRLQSALEAHEASLQALHGPQALVFHQAALAIDGNNYLAANELGVLLARQGQLDSARRLLVRSVSIRPQVESWHNLSVVHRRLGETELAQRADRERDLLSKKSGRSAGSAGNLVQWVDTRTFAAAGGDITWPENTAAKTPATSTGQRR